MTHEEKWWYCLRHMRAEFGAGCPDKDRMGPYDSKEAAETALSRAAERNEEWERQDEEWR